MTRKFEIYKNIPVGLIIKKDLKRKKMSQKTLAHLLGISYRSLNNAINGHRLFNREEADKIDNFFNYEESFIINLQEFKLSRENASELLQTISISAPYIRPCVFWDIDIKKINWIKHRKFIIERVSVYGSQTEREAVKKFYSKIQIYH